MSLDRVSTRNPQVAVPAALRVPALRVGIDAAAITTGVLALGLLVLLTWGTWGDLSRDTGFDWLAADRMAHGDLPYGDFTYYYGPLAVGLLAAVFAGFGTSVAAATAFGLVLAAAAVTLTYRLARRLTTVPGAMIAATLAGTAALATGNKSLVHPHSVSVSVAVVACLLALELAAMHAARPTRRSLHAIGVVGGLACLTRPEFAGALLVALGAWLTLRVASAPAADRARMRREAVRVLAIAVGLPLAAYALIAAAVGPAQLADGMLARDELRAGAGEVLRASAPLTLGSIAELMLHTLAYGAGAAALVGVGRLADRGGRARALVVVAIAAGLIGLALALSVRPEALRGQLDWAYSWIPLGAAACAVWLAVRARRPAAWPLRDQVALLVTVFLAVLAAKTYGAFDPQPNALRAQAAIYALPFAAIFLVWLHGEALGHGARWTRMTGLAWVAALAVAGVVLTAQDATRESATVHGPGGSIAALPGQAEPLQALLRAVDARTRPGEPVLFAPQMTALYVLAERPNPLAQLSLIPGALATPADEDAAIERLRDVRLVAIDGRARSEYGQGAFGEGFDRRLGAWLRRDFRRVATYRGAGDGAMTIDLWQRSAA
jgi:hypothetical protein